MTSFRFCSLRRQIEYRTAEGSSLSFPYQTLLTVESPTPRRSRSLSSRQTKLLCDELRKYPRRTLKTPDC